MREQPASADGVELQPVTSDDKTTDRAEGVAVAAPQGAAQALTGAVKNTKAAAILVTVGLAFQVFKEAIGLGAFNEPVDSVLQLVSGLLINVITISLALGSALIKAGFNRRQLLIILTIFTLIAPIAMIIGMAVGELSAPVNVVLLAFATGFYIYFSCAEVIAKEFADGQNSMQKIAAMVLGLIIILGLVFIESAHAH